MSTRNDSASIFTVGCRSTKALIDAGRQQHEAQRDDVRDDHELHVVDHADRGDHRVEREHDVDHHDLRDDR